MPRHDDDDDDDRPRSRSRDDDDDDEDDDRPRRRRRRRDDDDDWDRPKAKAGGGGKVVLIVLAIAGGLLLVCGVGGFFLIFPAITKVREAAARTQEMNNVKQASLGVMNHQNATGLLPRADGDLSWRVHILPYVEQDNLYRQFDLKRPWNQGGNQKLGDTFIKTYQSPLDDPPSNQTHYRVFTGDGTGFDRKLWPRGFPAFIPDGISNTVMIIDTAESVPWSAPKEIPVLPGGTFPDFGNAKRPLAVVAMFDGSVRSVDKKKIDAATARALASASGGEAVNLDW